MRLFGSGDNFLSLVTAKMEKYGKIVVIEVSPNLAKAWRSAPDEKRKRLGNEVSVRIGKELLKGSKGRVS
jgi:hypothetical protein